MVRGFLAEINNPPDICPIVAGLLPNAVTFESTNRVANSSL